MSYDDIIMSYDDIIMPYDCARCSGCVSKLQRCDGGVELEYVVMELGFDRRIISDRCPTRRAPRPTAALGNSDCRLRERPPDPLGDG